MDRLAGDVLSILANGVWQGTIAAILAAIAMRALSGCSASLRHAVLWVFLAAAALIPVVSTLRARAPETVVVMDAPRVKEPLAAPPAAPFVALQTQTAVADSPSGESSAWTARTTAPFTVAVWLIVAYAFMAAALLARVAMAFARAQRLKESAAPLARDTERLLLSLCIRHHVRRDVFFAASTGISSPAFVGFSRPTLLFPVDTLAGPDDELILAATHELAHAERYDDWLSLAAHVVTTALFFNPAIHWFARRISLERELACDEWAIGRTGVEPDVYAKALLSIAERVHSRRSAMFAQAIIGSSLRARVERLVSRSSDLGEESRHARAVALASIGAVTALAGFGAPSLSVHVAGTVPGSLAVSTQPDLASARVRLDSFAAHLGASGRSGALLVAVDGNIVMHRGFGVANRTTGTAVTAETRFNAGALAKMLTAAAIMQLEREGRLSLRDPVSRWLGALPAPKKEATIQHLLVHTAGLTAPDDAVFAGDRDQFIRGVRNARADFAPGTRRRYTDIGYSVLAAIVEMASGLRYEDYVRRHLLEPAGMRNTRFEPEGAIAPTATEYRNSMSAQSAVGARAYVWGRRGGMGVISTVGDLYLWHRALENGLITIEQRENFFGNDRDAERAVLVGYGWETSYGRSGALVHHFLSGWPGNSVELMHEPATKTTVSLIIDARVDWTRPRYNEITAVLGGGDAAAAARRAIASTPSF